MKKKQEEIVYAGRKFLLRNKLARPQTTAEREFYDTEHRNDDEHSVAFL